MPIPVSLSTTQSCGKTGARRNIAIRSWEAGYGEMIKNKTGLIIDAYFSATKIKWILDNVPGAREKAEAGKLRFGTVDTWLISCLTRNSAHVTDITNASRTMLFNIHTLQWDEELLRLFDIPASLLPEVKPSSCVMAYTTTTIFAHAVPIAGVAGRPAGCPLRTDVHKAGIG